MEKFTSGLVCIAIGFFIGVMLEIVMEPIDTHKCLTEKQVILKYEKYQMFIDSMTNSKKKDVERLSDSLNKYRIR